MVHGAADQIAVTALISGGGGFDVVVLLAHR